MCGNSQFSCLVCSAAHSNVRFQCLLNRLIRPVPQMCLCTDVCSTRFRVVCSNLAITNHYRLVDVMTLPRSDSLLTHSTTQRLFLYCIRASPCYHFIGPPREFQLNLQGFLICMSVRPMLCQPRMLVKYRSFSANSCVLVLSFLG